MNYHALFSLRVPNSLVFLADACVTKPHKIKILIRGMQKGTVMFSPEQCLV